MTRDQFIQALPKAELHLHIEGSLEPELLFELARRNRVEIPFSSPEEVRAAYSFERLQDFLDIYYQGMNVLLGPEDFYDLTRAYLARARQDNLRHVEIFFDPQGHTGRGVAFDHVVEGITAALDEAARDGGPSSHLILSFLRHLSEDEAFATLAEADSHLDKFVGVGLDSTEMGHPPGKFERVFARAGEMDLKLCAHAGEEGPPEYVRDSLDLLRIDRLDHGNRAMEDPRLVARLADSQMTLTSCPLSNLRLAVIADMRENPVADMLEAGLAVTVNSDDPAYFGGYLNDNYTAVAEALDLDRAQLATLARNSFTGAFLDEAAIAGHLGEIDSLLAGG